MEPSLKFHLVVLHLSVHHIAPCKHLDALQNRCCGVGHEKEYLLCKYYTNLCKKFILMCLGQLSEYSVDIN